VGNVAEKTAGKVLGESIVRSEATEVYFVTVKDKSISHPSIHWHVVQADVSGLVSLEKPVRSEEER
jgi:hypothetical protein